MSSGSAVLYDAVIVGGGPAGIGACVGFLRARAGAKVLVIERAAKLGGVPSKYASKPGALRTFVDWKAGRIVCGETLAAKFLKELVGFEHETLLETSVLSVAPEAGSLDCVSPSGLRTIHYQQLILACGARERSFSEREWVHGDRPAKTYNTMQVLDLLEGHGVNPFRDPVILGSDLVALSVAAKLGRAGSRPARLLSPREESGFLERAYFRLQERYSAKKIKGTARVQGFQTVSAVGAEETQHAGDGVVLAGDLIPNSELALEAGLPVSLPGRVPRHEGHRLGPRVFVCGNLLGGFHGASWCFANGKRVGRLAASFSTESS